MIYTPANPPTPLPLAIAERCRACRSFLLFLRNLPTCFIFSGGDSSKHRNLLFEGVCETRVILTPGACGSGVPNTASCHHFCGTGGTRRSRK